MKDDEQKPPPFKTSIWYVGLLVSSFCVVAGVVFANQPLDSRLPAPFSRQTATVIETPVPDATRAAQNCACHPNIIPAKIEKVPDARPIDTNHAIVDWRGNW